ncbi:spore gernimation protein [Clostridium botulinum]|uniref:Spore gernimation protein n=1 Tax=Clostridium botulinum TaxID=1491 RepID=A0A6B4Z3V3_CLOBO|nr:endospore germination permease [Clostridium botulinum]MBZ1329572.1 endospore germination permease [Clostridium botulinum]MBZ1332630.1 endospore germination permease [Clostridium botulinum]MBZ1336390.1 endospore germination permease [Clostridium botulinum]MBZ1339113.1 endospore germination permease [Clostridium botulinum]MBZ1342902.1 endospore germination permease [Clostridium botulinum]
MFKLNSKHVAFIILGTSIVSLKTYPEVFIVNGRNSSWVATIIASLIIFLYYLYIINISKKICKHSLWEVYEYALGKRLGKLFQFTFCLGLFFSLLESCSVDANAMNTNLLQNTPPWFFVVTFILSANYVLLKGERAVILMSLIGITFICIAGINLVILTAKYKTFKYLLPVFPNGIEKGFIISILQVLGLYGCVAIAYPYFQGIKDKKSALQGASIGLLIVIQMIIVSVTGVISTFGTNRAVTLAYPKLIQTQLVSYSGFLESGELFVMLQMLAGWFVKYVLSFQALLHLLKHFKIEDKKKKVTIWVLNIIVMIICLFMAKNTYKLLYILAFYPLIYLTFFIIIPFIIFTIALIRNKIKQNSYDVKNIN